MDLTALEAWILTMERKIREQEERLQAMEAQLHELEARVQALAAEMARYRQRIALLERILIEKGLLAPDLSLYDRWMGTIN
ncbi:MAG: hypothetical protein D6793_02100 [Thermoflexia bacterium]|nr:MAG: hypothetical protein D6793_02100 [Thermoflexia bacterium]